jgi:hypothetical protein
LRTLREISLRTLREISLRTLREILLRRYLIKKLQGFGINDQKTLQFLKN